VNLIKHGVPPERILAVTFTNKAAREMQERAAELLGKRRRKKGQPKPEISTFHSLCVRILRRQIHHLGYPRQFAIYDRGDQESLARNALREVNLPESSLKPGDLIGMISRWKMRDLSPAEAANRAQSDKEHLGAAAYRRYQEALKTSGAVDFDDLLRLVGQLFDEFPDVREEEAGRFDYLMVDEYQDTNGSQYKIVKALAAGHRNLCVVGDDDQSIYGWRGAEVTHILRFQKDWPEAKVVRLVTNYRSTNEIIHWSNRLIKFNSKRHDKELIATFDGEKPRICQLKNEEAEAQFVAQEIETAVKARQAHFSDFAVLFRTNDQPRLFEEQFRRYNIPYVLVGGQSFYDRKETRDILAYLKILANPRDEISLLRIINTPHRGIGQTTVQRFIEASNAQKSSIWEVLNAEDGSVRMAPAAARAVRGFRDLITKYRQKVYKEPLPKVVEQLVHEINYQDEVTRLYNNPDEAEVRWNSVGEVISSVSSYVNREPSPSLFGFIQEQAIADRTLDEDKDEKLQQNAVALMTLHSAKGLEFPRVYMVGMEEDILPHKKSVAENSGEVDEERRLCYVGLTRAQQRLTLTMALTRQKWGKERPRIPSRFLYEATGQADNPNYFRAVRGVRPRAK
jgi:DNA helicase-2/ATP-dependent DNA helicase PcrA